MIRKRRTKRLPLPPLAKGGNARARRSRRAARSNARRSADDSDLRIPNSELAPFRIHLAVRQRLLRTDRVGLARLARSVLRREQVSAAEISIAIVDDCQIHAVNRDFLGHDYATDVISFLLEEPGDGPPFRPSTRSCRRGTGKTLDGEIVISAETALRNAARYGVPAEREIALYLVHGLLHLCGYDDLTPREKRLMRRREAEALQ